MRYVYIISKVLNFPMHFYVGITDDLTRTPGEA